MGDVRGDIFQNVPTHVHEEILSGGAIVARVEDVTLRLEPAVMSAHVLNAHFLVDVDFIGVRMAIGMLVTLIDCRACKQKPQDLVGTAYGYSVRVKDMGLFTDECVKVKLLLFDAIAREWEATLA